MSDVENILSSGTVAASAAPEPKTKAPKSAADKLQEEAAALVLENAKIDNELKKLEQMIADREAEVAKEEAEEASMWSQKGGGAGSVSSPEQSSYSVQLLLEVSIESASVRLISNSTPPAATTRPSHPHHEGSAASREAGEICRASMCALKVQLKSFPVTLAVSLAIGRASVDSSQGPLFSTAVLSQSALPPSKTGPSSLEPSPAYPDGGKDKSNPFSRPSILSSDGKPSAFILNFKSKPQEGDADATLSLLIAPSYVTCLPAAVASTIAFFTSGLQTMRLTTLKAQASARAEQIGRLAQLQIRSLTALEDRPRLSVQLLCHAPKVAIPDESGNCTLLVDLGRQVEGSVPHASCLMPHASCLMPHASCLMPHASCLMPPSSYPHLLINRSLSFLYLHL